jgi:3-hydroxyacyl-CoA dehydrogenase
VDIKKVFVIGAGTMGNGIAQVTAQAGYDVIMSDIKDEFVKKGMDTIGKSLDRSVKKGTMTEADKAAILARIKTTTDNQDAKDADLVVEAAPEILELKKSIFKQLDGICKPEAILATNTSSLRNRRRHQKPRPGHRHPFHEPGAGDERRRGHTRQEHLRRHPGSLQGIHQENRQRTL